MVTYNQIESAVVKVDNSADSGATYSLSCNAHVYNDQVNSIYTGQVRKEDVNIASFDSMNGNISINFFQTASEERTEILNAVTSFIEEVKAYVKENPIVK